MLQRRGLDGVTSFSFNKNKTFDQKVILVSFYSKAEANNNNKKSQFTNFLASNVFHIQGGDTCKHNGFLLNIRKRDFGAYALVLALTF